ncbi:MAG: strawberry notch C-terminal domain-containing protein, partial [Planctomycetes bacterium]|nr:strawberry notch C-terminal domain-containing protein [Planctomycetota bacterium]
MTDEYGAAALARFNPKIEINRHKDAGLGMPELERMGLLDADRTNVKDHFRRNVNHFLNRIMVLPVDKQNAMFELFYERYLQAVEGAKRAGAFDFGVEEIRA